MIDSKHKEKTSIGGGGGGGAGGDASCLRSVDAAGPSMVLLFSLLLYHRVYVVRMDREGWSLRNVVLGSVAERTSALALDIAAEVSSYRLLCKRRSIVVVNSSVVATSQGSLSLEHYGLELRKHF